MVLVSQVTDHSSQRCFTGSHRIWELREDRILVVCLDIPEFLIENADHLPSLPPPCLSGISMTVTSNVEQHYHSVQGIQWRKLKIHIIAEYYELEMNLWLFLQLKPTTWPFVPFLVRQGNADNYNSEET